MPADLTAGLEYNRDNLKDDMWGYNRYTKQTVNIGSAFLQNEWKNEKWSILLGGRLDKHNLINHVIFSPRANLRFNPSEDINLRLSYSSGFRAPQAFDEDLHIENVGGTVSMIERAKNLKEEKSQSFSASADMYHRFGAFQVNFLVEGFYTRLSDVFVLENIGERDGILIKERRNGSGAKYWDCRWREKWLISLCSSYRQESRCNRAVMTNRKSGAKRHRPRRRFSVRRIPMGTLRQRIRRSSLCHYPCRHVHRIDAGAAHGRLY